MKTIWKFPLETFSETLKIPKGGLFLDAQMQHGKITLWFQVESNNDLENWDIKIYPTGGVVFDGHCSHLATVQEGAGVWHVYVLGEITEETAQMAPSNPPEDYDEYREKIDDLRSEFDDLESKVDDFPDFDDFPDLDDLSSDVSAVKEKCDELESSISDTDDNVDALDDRVEAIESRLDALEAKQNDD